MDLSKELERTVYFIALTKIPGVGDVVAKKLIAYCGGVREVFSHSRSALEQIPGIGKVLAHSVKNGSVLRDAEKEFIKAQKLGVRVVSFLDDAYPHRLKHCEDSPLILYVKGNGDLNPERCVSIVGTRNATNYGKEITQQIVRDLAAANVTIISGLAYGIDITAHRSSLKYETPTIGALAHGLDRIYPSAHTITAKEMQENGALISDFPTGTKPDRENFPKRNRIVAGMSDATIVVEAAIKGGALITGEIANGYNRDVFAVPGRASDQNSAGCNRLILHNKAALITSGSDVLKAMSWDDDKSTKTPTTQSKLLIDLSPEQEKLVAELRKNEMRIDELAIACEYSMSKAATVLLELEFEGIVSSLPGKVYKLN